jgi:hypothetical protein
VSKSRTDHALRACRAAYLAAFEAHAAYGDDGHMLNPEPVAKLASSAYKTAMPELLDWLSIRAYIACVSQGQVLDVFNERQARTLMFTAQTALSTFARAKRTE